MFNQEEIAADRTIDPEELDVEAVKQADLYGKWAERSAATKGEAERREWEVELCEARLQTAVRRNPEHFGITKLTEEAIKAVVKSHHDFIAAVKAWHAARLEWGLTVAAEKAMDQKKSMLCELGRLHGASYFAGPEIPRDLIGIWQAHRAGKGEEAQDRLRSKVRKRITTQEGR